MCFPEDGDPNILERMLAGGLSKMVEANCTVIGGHSIRDPEIKLGYSVTGTVHPQAILANSGARAGDRLVFTKAIGTGVISTAIKRTEGRLCLDARRHSLHDHAQQDGGRDCHRRIRSTRHDRYYWLWPDRPCARVGARLGCEPAHLRVKVPLLEGALECVRRGYIPGGLKSNRGFAEGCVEYAADVPEDLRTLLYDPQTAGGLLISVAAADCDRLVEKLLAAGVCAKEIGEVLEKQAPLIAIEA